MWHLSLFSTIFHKSYKTAPSPNWNLVIFPKQLRDQCNFPELHIFKAMLNKSKVATHPHINRIHIYQQSTSCEAYHTHSRKSHNLWQKFEENNGGQLIPGS